MSESKHRSRGGRFALVLLMVIALSGAVAANQWQLSLRSSAAKDRFAARGSSLSRLNSYALGLLLGGFRGPLVMILWSSSESQKANRNLEDFDTMVEWIRLLQPEFDSVHIFQVWNKAYNISVQMASLSNKYVTILDAIDYAQRMNIERPDNINIVTAEGQVWSDKLGNSAEKAYYRQRVRAETLPHKARMGVARSDPAWRRVELDPMVDDKGMVLPDLLVPVRPKAVSPKIDDGVETSDTGAPMAFLERFQPFPYGVSPYAVAYNLYKRAQLLQTNNGQRHAQLSDQVVDSRPALTLKLWSEEEWELARKREIAAFGLEVPADRQNMEVASAAITPGVKPSDPRMVDEALFEVRRSADLASASIAEYQRHLATYRGNISTYRLHLDELKSHVALGLGDEAYLRWVTGTSRDAAADRAAAIRYYTEAMQKYAFITLKYFIDEQVVSGAVPNGKVGVEQIPADQLPAVRIAALRLLAQRTSQYDTNAEDRQEYDAYIARCEIRLRILAGAR